MAPALILLTGILLHDQFPVRPWGILACAALLGLMTLIFLRRRIPGTIALALMVLLLGVGIAQREHFEFATDDIGLFATDEPRLTQLEVRLLDEPQISVGPPSQRQLPPKQLVTAQVLRLKTWGGWVPVTGQLPMQISQIHPQLNAGQIVRVLGMLQRPRSAMNPGEFDWSAYYRQQRILATFTITRADNIQILSDPGASPINWLRAKARHLLAMGFTQPHSVDYALLDALLLGNRDPAFRDVEQRFQQTGTGYQLSVSGLHIAILAAGVFWICRFFLMRPRVTLIVTTGFILLYAAVSLPSHSGIRAAILSVFALLAIGSGRPIDRAQFLALGMIAMLLWHPLDIYSAGFHLSFAMVVVFLLLLPPLRQWLQSLRDPDQKVLEQIRQQTAWQHLRHRCRARVVRGLMYAVLAWLATLPLVAYHFGQASSWAIAGGLVLLPVAIVALFGGALKVLFTLLWPRWAGIWAVPAGWPIEAMQWIVHQLAKLPGSTIPLPTPPIWLIVVYYLLLLAPLLPYRWMTGRRRWVLRLAPLAGVAAIITLHPHPPGGGSDELKITLLSLGAGQCAVVEVPGGHPVLFDAGSSTVQDLVGKIVGPFLKFEGQTKVDEIFLSHGDFDHISAAGEIAADYGVKQVLTSFHFRRNSAGNIPDLVLLDELEKLNLSPRQIALGDHLDLGGGAAVDVLWPPPVGDLNSNNAGLVLRLRFAGRSVLFPADIQDPGFTGVLKNARALQSDVLIAAHHGSSEDLTPAFLTAVHADWILSSNLGRLTNKQKRFNTMVGDTPFFRTSDCGAITITISREGKISITTFRKKK